MMLFIYTIYFDFLKKCQKYCFSDRMLRFLREVKPISIFIQLFVEYTKYTHLYSIYVNNFTCIILEQKVGKTDSIYCLILHIGPILTEHIAVFNKL